MSRSKALASVILVSLLFATSNCSLRRQAVSRGGCTAAPRPPSIAALAGPELDAFLEQAVLQFPDFTDRLRYLALARLGTRYALGTLGEEIAPDTEPLFRLDEADCTVLVLTTTALAHAASEAEARDWMRPVNYKRGSNGFEPRFENRWHFTSDRVTESPLFTDITSKVSLPTERRRIEFVLNETSDGTELLELGWKRPMAIDFVPVEYVSSVVRRLPKVVGVAFVRQGNVAKGLVVAHEGFLLDGLCLVHASAIAEEVVMVDLFDYLLRPNDPEPQKRGSPRFDGVIFYTINDASDSIEPLASS